MDLDELLDDDEAVHVARRPHWRVPSGALAFALVLAVAAGFAHGALDPPYDLAAIGAAVAIWLVLAGPAVWRWHHGWHVLTSHRALAVSGRRLRCEVDLPIEEITEIRVERGAWGLLLGYGDVVLATDDEETTLFDVRAPRRFRTRIVRIAESRQL